MLRQITQTTVCKQTNVKTDHNSLQTVKTDQMSANRQMSWQTTTVCKQTNVMTDHNSLQTVKCYDRPQNKCLQTDKCHGRPHKQQSANRQMLRQTTQTTVCKQTNVKTDHNSLQTDKC